MAATRFFLGTIALFAALAACSKSGGGGEPPITPNAAPTLNPDSQLSGTGGTYSLTLDIANTATLTFSASDPENDLITWQVVGGTATAAAVGLTLPSTSAGTTYVMQLSSITQPAALSLVLIAQDAKGNASAIDLLIVRTGAPTITSISPSSAFASAPQPVVITGTALSLGGTVTTRARFAGLPATFTTVPNETTLRCSTPSGLTTGPTSVAVENIYGSSTLAASAFTAYSLPAVFGATDQAIDGGAGGSAAIAQDGAMVHAAWIEGGAAMHRSSADGGTTWGTAQTLSGAEVSAEPQIIVTGQNVTIAWLGDGTTINVRNSTDGGASFDPAQIVNPSAGTQIARQPRACGNGDRRYIVWLAGDPLQAAARVVFVTSPDAGATWSSPATVSNGGAQQAAHAIACSSTTAWVAFTDERQGGGTRGTYVSRTTDNGATWSAASLRSQANTPTSEPRLCADNDDVHLTWLRGSVLRYARSTNAGAAWSSPVDMQGTVNAALSWPVISCQGKRVFAAYVAGGNSVWVSRITATGAAPQHVQVSTAAVVAGFPRIIHRGNYVFVGWRSDDVATGAARIQHSISTDVGQTFGAPTGFGDGSAAQDELLMLADGARLLFCWLDYRGATPALFTNRNNP